MLQCMQLHIRDTLTLLFCFRELHKLKCTQYTLTFTRSIRCYGLLHVQCVHALEANACEQYAVSLLKKTVTFFWRDTLTVFHTLQLDILTKDTDLCMMFNELLNFREPLRSRVCMGWSSRHEKMLSSNVSSSQ